MEVLSLLLVLNKDKTDQWGSEQAIDPVAGWDLKSEARESVLICICNK